MRILNKRIPRKLTLSVLIATTLLFSTFSVIGAIKYTISTNDATGVTEWFDQSIPVFQVDPIEGDPIPADEDIVNAWIVTGVDNQLYFMVEMAGNPAISKPDSPYNGVGVWLDCDANGDTTDAVDRFISYYYANGYDRVSWFRGSDGNGSTVDDGTLGQIDRQFVEWTIKPTFANGMLNCQTQMNVKFLSVRSENAAGFQTISDETDSFRGFDFPTAVKNTKFSGSSFAPKGIGVALISLLMISMAISIYIFKRRMKFD